MAFRETEPTVTIGLRLPLSQYTRGLDMARARGDKVLSTILRDAIVEGLTQLSVKEARPEATS